MTSMLTFCMSTFLEYSGGPLMALNVFCCGWSAREAVARENNGQPAGEGCLHRRQALLLDICVFVRRVFFFLSGGAEKG